MALWVLGTVCPKLLPAANVTWNSADHGYWFTAWNWSSLTSLPGAKDNVVIAAASGSADPYVVTFGPGLTARAMTLTLGSPSAPRAALSMAGGALTVDTGSTDVALLLNSADLAVASGATLNLWTSDEKSTAGRSALKMSGGSAVIIDGSLIARQTGGAGSGPNAGLRMGAAAGTTNTFTIRVGGSAAFGYSSIGSADAGSSADGQNHVVVDGGVLTLRAMELGRLANAGNATLTVKNSGTLAVAGSGATIGGGTGASGEGELIIGEHDGSGGGVVTLASNLAVAAGTSNGTGTVTMHAGSLTANNHVVLGNSTSANPAATSSGTMNIHGGTFTLGTYAARNVIVAGQENSSGTLNITGGVVDVVRAQGDHALRLAPTVTKGNATGTINLSGGTLNVDKFHSRTAAGTINFTGGIFAVKQATVNNGRTFTVGGGTNMATLRMVGGIGSGRHTFADGLVISTNARLDGTGLVNSPTTVRGVIAATSPAKELAFASGLTLLDGATIDLNGDGRISVTGGSLIIADGATINVTRTNLSEGEALTLFRVVGDTPDLSGVSFMLNGTAVSGAWVDGQFQIIAISIAKPLSHAAWITDGVVVPLCARPMWRV